MNCFATLRLARCLAASLVIMAMPDAQASTDIDLWHSMEGTAQQQIERIASAFNASQTLYRVVPAYKGSARETLDATLATTNHGPQIVQIDDSLRGATAESSRAFKPVYQVLQQAGVSIDRTKFLPSLAEESLDRQGRLISLPFGVSTPVLFYNRDAFGASGLDPDQPPRTWLKVQEFALKLMQSGSAACGFTTEAPAWVHLENLLASHDQPLTATSGKETRFVFNTRLAILHVSLLSSWARSGLFQYSGNSPEAVRRFTSGQCAMLTGASGARGDIERNTAFKLGMAALPMHDGAQPAGVVPNEARLWVLAGRSKAEYTGVARFFAYLLRPEVQAEWHQQTGYLPATEAGAELTRKTGFYASHPGADVAVSELPRSPAAGVKLARFAPATYIRSIVNEELEAAWMGRKAPKDAVDAAVERGNRLLKYIKVSPK